MRFLVKSIIVFVLVLIVVFFALANAHEIRVNLGVGQGMNVRVISLMLVSYLLGILTSIYFMVISRIEARRRGRKDKQPGDEDE